MIYNHHIHLARTALNLTQTELAKQSGISTPTIKDIESSKPNEELKNNKIVVMALLKFFEDEGVEFIDDQDSLGVKVGKKVVRWRFR
ncbi:MAG: helix-turn-helix transcriptional regulator [Pseudomonadota bacterium]